MQTRVRDNPPRRLLDRFREHPIVASMPRLVPALKAYGGLRVSDPRLSRTGETLGRIGALEVRLAHRAAEIRRAQRLRFDVFYQEMSAVADAATLIARRDVDPYDAMCDHLLVLDHDRPKTGAVRPWSAPIGCCVRRSPSAAAASIAPGSSTSVRLIARHRGLRFLELGRSCVLPTYRNKRTVELLWHGIWTYVLRHKVDVMIGCASLEGTDPDALAPAAFVPASLCARAGGMAGGGACRTAIARSTGCRRRRSTPRRRCTRLPPLIKGYLRLGAFVGDGAVIDHQFGTTDILVVLPVAAINLRYIDHFGPSAERHAA